MYLFFKKKKDVGKRKKGTQVLTTINPHPIPPDPRIQRPVRAAEEAHPQEPLVDVPHLEPLGGEPGQEPERPALVDADGHLDRALLPRGQVPADVQDDLRVGIGLDHLGREARGGGVGHGDAVAQELVELGRGDVTVAVWRAGIEPFLAREPHPAADVVGFFEQDVPAVVGVVVAEHDQGLLEGLGGRLRGWLGLSVDVGLEDVPDEAVQVGGHRC